MRFYLPKGMLKRPDADISDLTTAERTGEPYWAPDEVDVLVVPMDREPTADEQAAILQRITTDSGVEGTLQARAVAAYADLQAFERLTNPTNAQRDAVLRLLCKVARALIRLQLRRLDAVD